MNILIAGPSGSGKTTLATALRRLLSQQLTCTLIHEDNYYRAQDQLSLAQRTDTNYDAPEAFEHELLAEHLQLLSQGEPIEQPQYCYKTHTRLYQTQTTAAASVNIIEGILTLHSEQLRSQADVCLFVDTPLDICLLRRINRDLSERGRQLADVTQQYQRTVRPMLEAFVMPQREHANYRVNLQYPVTPIAENLVAQWQRLIR